MYYADKLNSLADIFGVAEVTLEPDALIVNSTRYAIIDDVIILTAPHQYTATVRQHFQGTNRGNGPVGVTPAQFAEDIQYTFGEEWQRYDQVLAEHEQEFRQYFDLVELAGLRDKRVCDLGCGSGRWSYHLQPGCRELVLVDFSDAIFIARRNLAGANNCLFFMGDLTQLPFRENFADFLFCLGVLHHLPSPCLAEVRNLRQFAPLLLIYLYYALDNRPVYFRAMLGAVTFLRLQVSKIRRPAFRQLFAQAGTILLYLPLILLGKALRPFNLSSAVPLYDTYHDKSLSRIQQDVYDRFFTRIEQRVSRQEIMELRDSFRQVTISEQIPYWHFLCCR